MTSVKPTERLTAGQVLAALGLAATVTAVLVVGVLQRDPLWLLELDFKVYHATGTAVLDGVSPFDAASADGFLFIYPPFAALLLTPLGLMTLHVAFAVWTFLTVLALVASVWLALRLVAPGMPARRARFALLVTVAALPTLPVFLHLGAGQVNALLMLLILVDLSRRTGRFQGVALGIAAGIKLTPLIFVGYLLITRRFRAAAVSLASFAATVVVGLLVLPGASAAWWGGMLIDTARMTPDGSAPFNMSLRGVLGQLHAPWLWQALAIVVGLGGLAVAAWASRRGREAAGVMACALTGVLVSPVSWQHHWIWLVPGLALWLWWGLSRRETARTWSGVALTWLVLVASSVLTFVIVVSVPNMATTGAMTTVLVTAVTLNSLIVVAALGFLGGLAVVLWRGDHRSTSDTSRPPARAPEHAEVGGV